MIFWTKSSPTHETGLQIGRFCDWCGSFELLEIWGNLSTWKFGWNHRPLMKMVSRLAHFCEWCGSFVLQVSRNSRQENLDEIIVHSWQMVSRSSFLWTKWLSCIIDLIKFSAKWFWTKSSPTHWKWSPDSSLMWMLWLSWITDIRKLLDMKNWTKSSPTHENGLQLAHFYEWSGSLVL